MRIKKMLLSLLVAAPLPALSVPSGAPYNVDPVSFYANDMLGGGLEQVNNILCMIDQTKHSDSTLINTGWFLALVNDNRCQVDSSELSGSASSNETGQSSVQYVKWKVRAQRLSSTSPESFSAFVYTPEGERYVANSTIQSGKTEKNPFGLFNTYFKQQTAAQSTPTQRGMMVSSADSSGTVTLTFSSTEQNSSSVRSRKLAFRKAGNKGAGSIYQYDKQSNPGNGISLTNFAYDENRYAIKKSNTSLCYDRNSRFNSVWSYGLYDEITGARIEPNGGFSVTDNPESSSGQWGQIGYYGLWWPSASPAPTDGATLYKVENNQTSSSTPYTLVVRNGFLTKNTRHTSTLGNLKNIPMEGVLFPNDQKTYRVKWSNNKLNIVAYSIDGQTWVNTTGQIDSSTSLIYSPLGLWSQGLGGQTSINPNGCIQNGDGSWVGCNFSSDSTVVYYTTETQVPGDSVPASLTCYSNCPYVDSTGKVGTQDVTGGTTYAFDVNSDLLLRDGQGVPIVSDSENGAVSGPLFVKDTESLSKLSCDWNPSEMCAWKAYSVLDTYYTWTTSKNSYDHLSVVKDVSGATVKFDKPLQINFTYPTASTGIYNTRETDAKYSGNTFALEYQAYGNGLNNIPGRCIDPLDPSKTIDDCSKPGLEWIPDFNVPTGSRVTMNNTDGTSTNYLVKALNVEQRLSQVSLNQCSSLKFQDLSKYWPDLNKSWIDPVIGDDPNLTKPKVVDGKILGSK